MNQTDIEILKLSEAGRAALAEVARLLALADLRQRDLDLAWRDCDDGTCHTCAKCYDAAIRARDEVGLQLVAAQAVIARMQPVVDACRTAVAKWRAGEPYDLGHYMVSASSVLDALDTVPGDALPPSPAGWGRRASGSTPAASSATSSSSEVEGSRCGQSGTWTAESPDGVRFAEGDAAIWMDSVEAWAAVVVEVRPDGSVVSEESFSRSRRRFHYRDGAWRCGCMTLHRDAGIDAIRAKAAPTGLRAVAVSHLEARVLLDRIADPKMNDRPAVHVFDADVKGGE